MTREEAIRQIRDNIDFRKCLQEGDKPQFFDADENEKDIEAFEMAIRALKNYDEIVQIINSPIYIQEDVFRYKAICAVVEDEAE